MTRPLLGLAVLGVYFAIAFAARIALHKRRTGSTGFVGFSGARGSTEWWSGTLFTLAAIVAPIGALLELTFVASTTISTPDWTLWAGLAGAAVGVVGTFIAQSTMGDSWRVGVRPSESTQLVTGGLYSVIRNPIFTFLWIAMASATLIAPSIFTLASLAAFVAAVEMQVRLVEEPYLERQHGPRYEKYRDEVGRFFPLFG